MNRNPLRPLFAGKPGRALAAAAFLLALTLNLGAAPAGPLPESIPGRPLIVVSSAVAVPRAGDEASFPRSFDAKLTVKNTGWVIAYRVVLSIPSNDYVGVENGSSSLSLGYIYAGRTKDITVPMYLDKADENGRVQPVFQIEFWDDEGRKYERDEPVRMEFGGQGWNKPILIVSENATAPENPAPGEECRLTLTLSNMSNGDARKVLVRLGGDGGPKPFLTVGTSNVGFSETVPANGKSDVVFPLQVEGSAVPGVYAVPVSLSFQNILGETLSDSVVIYLKVRTLPSLQASLLTAPPSPIKSGDEFDLAVEVINSGLQTLNVGTVELMSDTLTITNGSAYSGPLDASTSTSLTATVKAGEPGPGEITVVVHYLDEYNRPQTWTHAFHFEVEAAAQTPDPAAPDTSGESSALDQIWKAILGFLGFGG